MTMSHPPLAAIVTNADETVTGWFAPQQIKSLVGMKEAEVVVFEGKNGDEICAPYRSAC